MPAGQGNTSQSAQRRALVRSLAEAYDQALLAGDPAEAERVARDAIDAGLDEAVIAGQVITPALRRVGDLWERNRITPAEEHLATHISLRVLALQREAFRVARARAGHRVMLAAVEGERHVVGLEMAANLLAHAGFDVRVLGADVPIESLEPIVRRHAPQAFCLSATMAWSAELLPLAVDELQRADPTLAVVLGGPAALEGRPAGPSAPVVGNLAELAETVDALLRRPSLN